MPMTLTLTLPLTVTLTLTPIVQPSRMVGTMTLRMRKNNGRYRMRARSSSMGRVEGAQVASMMATWDSEPEKSALQRISRSCENIVAQMQMTEGRRSHVTLPDERVLDILIQPKLYAGELLDIVASHFNLKEKEYFGLTYAADTYVASYVINCDEHNK
ncbi:PREDICTED: FERM domain-containing protein 4B-like [Priapulus caudatus]|uniref:FERM domain-containing protein 4B-like n=1 Tax=Priapulus caudatus TaxID=37621 RepID=A0ABM1EFP1_PRICU|nr:PREDICTED: FERM domain-containing protein 4B-like [Priapulus caudatus]